MVKKYKKKDQRPDLKALIRKHIQRKRTEPQCKVRNMITVQILYGRIYNEHRKKSEHNRQSTTMLQNHLRKIAEKKGE